MKNQYEQLKQQYQHLYGKTPKLETISLENTPYTLRPTRISEDLPYVETWYSDPAIRKQFYPQTPLEMKIDICERLQMANYNASITATIDGKPCGVCTLLLRPHQSMSHHANLFIITQAEYRNKGLGALLLNHMIKVAKDNFKMKAVYVRVLENSPAVRLYERCSFIEISRERKSFKYGDEYFDHIIMEQIL
ncbi:Uncharacterized protein CLAVI_000642 [Candidatus Clavichlamydia salmonicola]|uniref:GNAT family N-acetyltransferase n=1 Tax=Candidatus Clavichlamydia salmonicola TaxID=469812 RepID=UPI0018917AD6|nr:GNAT family protein [Candidatus Clavichlamydia salmonicola]MBF5051015.1 Uncharacterized protein [Candidatus Clavichlamydia salmonicola]